MCHLNESDFHVTNTQPTHTRSVNCSDRSPAKVLMMSLHKPLHVHGNKGGSTTFFRMKKKTGKMCYRGRISRMRGRWGFDKMRWRIVTQINLSSILLWHAARESVSKDEHESALLPVTVINRPGTINDSTWNGHMFRSYFVLSIGPRFWLRSNWIRWFSDLSTVPVMPIALVFCARLNQRATRRMEIGIEWMTKSICLLQ